jgi:hypothetical protein
MIDKKSAIETGQLPKKQLGLALLLMLSLLLIALTAVAITQLSLNSSAQKRQALTTKALTDTRNAIMAWALTQTTITHPPGTLPCPDTNRNGNANISGAICTSEFGFVPYRTLGIAEPRDGDGTPLWYGVSNAYAGSVNLALNQLRNSSLASPLFINNNTNRIAFVVMSSGDALDSQNRGTISLATSAEFLEGLNVNNTFTDYSDLRDATHNDQLLSVSEQLFWAEIEQRVLVDMAALVRQFRTSCNRFPWAVPFTATNTTGVVNTYQGRLPISNEWGASGACPTAPNFQPQWLRDHWGSIIYYALCKDTSPANPPTTSCLNLGNSVTAKAILSAPGSPLPSLSQNRGALTLSNYLENENATPVDNIFKKLARTQHTATFNDLITIVTP